MTASALATWTEQVVLVTGASGGLGQALAEEFAAAGAQLILVGRREEVLRTVAEKITAAGGKAKLYAADVTQDESVAGLFEFVETEFGRLDVLVNNVGLSMRKSVLETTAEDMRQQMEVNFLSTVRCSQAALPLLQKSRGRIVNIGSLASKVGTRFLGGYPPSKHAVAAYSQQLRLELAESGVSVLLVCPGPIARDTPRTYGADQDANLPADAAKPGGGAKLNAIDPNQLAKKILAAAAKRKPELVVPGKARLLFALAQLFPKLGDNILRKKSS